MPAALRSLRAIGASGEATGSDEGDHRILAVLPNVWLGTSVESADYLGRINDLRKVDVAVRFVTHVMIVE
ncbi:hypothetical protein [Bradyrhizobium japonicum]|uniref:Uncharacterized protein n=1 Tax=Bradyrhizobium japonicum TaxID=375 RepID=A0ABV2RPU4_BRAJP|nr:hypothetical protein [Bradyrhizobium japonicum]MCP1763638.1 hypothetical protein [Bradyrhizobium japonicum]MCP1785775.1 hypothetical protein [Bradyrhizobium japonicum]MCP1807654.1 hypothetical protein [Bradyrhizobium japonicum]MCP1816581.1 hypothetical protein [Bradyrhizobium japonicum]MCP1871906.1 hypothetical protein [Bradyrhizobium japonicum]